MVTMENSEEVMQILERYTRQKQKEIPKELDEYLKYVAKTGDTLFNWSSLKYLFREKLLNVIKNFHDSTTTRDDDIPSYPNVDPFNYENMKSTLLERLEMFNSAPFTIQRLCELLIEPKKQYNQIDKFMRALEKNILVVSTIDPGRKRTDSENGSESPTGVAALNGDVSMNVFVDIDSETEMSSGKAKPKVDAIKLIGTSDLSNVNDSLIETMKTDDGNVSKLSSNEVKDRALIGSPKSHRSDDDEVHPSKKARLDLNYEDKTQNNYPDEDKEETKTEAKTEENEQNVDDFKDTTASKVEDITESPIMSTEIADVTNSENKEPSEDKEETVTNTEENGDEKMKEVNENDKEPQLEETKTHDVTDNEKKTASEIVPEEVKNDTENKDSDANQTDAGPNNVTAMEESESSEETTSQTVASSSTENVTVETPASEANDSSNETKPDNTDVVSEKMQDSSDLNSLSGKDDTVKTNAHSDPSSVDGTEVTSVDCTSTIAEADNENTAIAESSTAIADMKKAEDKVEAESKLPTDIDAETSNEQAEVTALKDVEEPMTGSGESESLKKSAIENEAGSDDIKANDSESKNVTECVSSPGKEESVNSQAAIVETKSVPEIAEKLDSEEKSASNDPEQLVENKIMDSEICTENVSKEFVATDAEENMPSGNENSTTSIIMKDQPMDAESVVETAAAEVSEVTMAEAEVTEMATDAMETAKDDPAGMDVDDNSQELMDQ